MHAYAYTRLASCMHVSCLHACMQTYSQLLACMHTYSQLAAWRMHGRRQSGDRCGGRPRKERVWCCASRRHRAAAITVDEKCGKETKARERAGEELTLRQLGSGTPSGGPRTKLRSSKYSLGTIGPRIVLAHHVFDRW